MSRAQATLPVVIRSIAVVVATILIGGGTTSQAQVVRQITDLRTEDFAGHSIDGTGATAWAVTTLDVAGANPDHAHRVAGWTLPATAGAVLAGLTDVADGISVSDDGQWLAVISVANPGGTNPDLSPELFLAATDGSSLVALTQTPGPAAPPVLEARLAGSGNRVVFRFAGDPLGTNPANHEQLFVIDADGTDLVQLTSAGPGETLGGFSISDDGTRIAIAFDGNPVGTNPDGGPEVFGVESDGTGLRQLTSSATGEMRTPQISGNGAAVAYGAFEPAFGQERVLILDWTTTAVGNLAVGARPSITDDAATVVFQARDADNYEIWSVPGAGGSVTRLTDTDSPLDNLDPVVSGDGSRVLYRTLGDDVGGGSGGDDAEGLWIVDADGSDTVRLALAVTRGGSREPDVTPDGGLVVFRANGQLDQGSGIAGAWDLFLAATDGSGLIRLTTEADALHPSIRADGTEVVFESDRSLTGANACSTPQIYRVSDDGSLISQLTPADNCANNVDPVIADDGSVVVFQSDGDFAGSNPDGGGELFAVPAAGGAITQVGDDDSQLFKSPRCSASCGWIAYHSNADPLGTNPSGRIQVFRVRLDGTDLEQITFDPSSSSLAPDVSSDGTTIAFQSWADPLGSNPEQNAEIFVWDAPTGTTTQLTATAEGQSASPRISRDGAWVWFLSTSPWFGPNVPGDALWRPYRVEVATGRVERVGGMADRLADLRPTSTFIDNVSIAVDAAGGGVFTAAADASDRNPDLNEEVWHVDPPAYNAPVPDRSTPAIVRWAPAPKPVAYDLVRGLVGNLAAGAPGSVDLGPVVCLADDRREDPRTGVEDFEEPAVGEAFFYVWRGTQGPLDGPGSWGRSSAGDERLASSGSCAD